MSEADRAAHAPEYNKVLEAYVDESDDELDLQGLVAYALNKRQKRDWIVRYRTARADRHPSGEEIDAVTSTYLTDDVHAGLRKRASDILSNYAEVYVQAITPQLREQTLTGEVLRQAKAIETSIEGRSGFWSAVWVGVVSTALWTLLVTAVVVAALLFGSDLISAWRSFATGAAF